jgi:hypothetical protein
MSDLKSAISSQINAAGPGHVWVPTDFAHLGNRDAIDKTLQRMVLAGDLRRIDRGLYDKPSINRLTQRPTPRTIARLSRPSRGATNCACWWMA